MSKGLPWFRMYADFLNDPKMIGLAFEDQRHFVGVLALKCSGVIDQDCDAELLDRIVAQRLWIDHSIIREIKKRLLAAGLIGDNWQPRAWDKRQFRSDADPTGADRQRRFKERKRAETAKAREGDDGNGIENASGNGEVTPPETDAEADKEEKKEPKARKRANSSLSAEDLVADGVAKQVALDWLTLRTAKRLPLTRTAWDAVKLEAQAASMAPAQAVAYAVAANWVGFNANWVLGAAGRTRNCGNWWASDELALSKANEVGVGPAHRHESRDAWHARIKAAIETGGKPAASHARPVISLDPVAPAAEQPRTGPSEASRAAMAGAFGILKSKTFGAARQ